MKSALMVISVICIIVFGPGAAIGASFSFSDSGVSKNYWPGWGNGYQDDTDVIGQPQLTGGTGNISGNGDLNDVTISYTTSSVYIAAGDLFIDKGADNTWDYVLTTWNWNGAAPNPNSTDPEPNLPFKIYDLSQITQSRDMANPALYNITSEYDWGNLTPRTDHPFGLDTSLVGLLEIGEYFFQGFNDSGKGTVQFKDFVFSEGYSLNLGSDDFIIGFGSSCANDVIYQQVNNPVSIPGSLLLLSSGIFGLIGLRRRNQH